MPDSVKRGQVLDVNNNFVELCCLYFGIDMLLCTAE